MKCNDLPMDPWSSYSYSDDFLGEKAATANDDNNGFRGHYSDDDLFELVWQGGGGRRATGQPAVSRLQSSPLPALPPPPPEPERVPLNHPPFEDVMAAWLYPIVSGQDHDGDGLTTTNEASEVIGSSGTMLSKSKGKLLATDGMSDTKTCKMSSTKVASKNYHEDTSTRSDSIEKNASGGSSNRKGSSHNSEKHNIAEKRRRCRITERLRTLQQLVPGCDKSNQASTLDQTIEYMKSLQNHVQAMSMRQEVPSSVAEAGYPFLHTPAAAGGHVIQPAGMVPMVPFGAMLPYAHYHAVMMPAAAAAVMAAPLYRPAPDVSIDGVSEGRDLPQCSVSMEQQHQHKEKGRERS